MKKEKNTIPFSRMNNISLVIIVLTIGMFSCKKDSQRLNNTNNDTYSDTDFINNIKLNPDYCGAYYNIDKSVTYPTTHPAANILSDYTNSVGSNSIWSMFQIGIENDYKVLIQDIYHTFKYYNNDINVSLEFNVNSETQVSSNILADSLIFYSGYKSFKIINVEAEFIATILNTNPLSVRFDVKILKGKLVNNSLEYDLSNSNIKFTDIYTLDNYISCLTGCYSQLNGRTYIGKIMLYKGLSKDTLLYEYLNDTVNIRNFSYSGTYEIQVHNFLKNLKLVSFNRICTNVGTNLHKSSGNTSFNNNTYFLFESVYGSLGFYEFGPDSLKINLNIDGTLKTSEMNIINQNVDTTQQQRYNIVGLFEKM
jgi:hypothetical protein